MIKESTYMAFIIIDFLEEDKAFDNLSFYYVIFYNISEKIFSFYHRIQTCVSLIYK